jgi:hypothetical protein
MRRFDTLAPRCMPIRAGQPTGQSSGSRFHQLPATEGDMQLLATPPIGQPRMLK